MDNYTIMEGKVLSVCGVMCIADMWWVIIEDVGDVLLVCCMEWWWHI